MYQHFKVIAVKRENAEIRETEFKGNAAEEFSLYLYDRLKSDEKIISVLLMQRQQWRHENGYSWVTLYSDMKEISFCAD